MIPPPQPLAMASRIEGAGSGLRRSPGAASRFLLLVSLIVALGAAVRIPGLFDDFWLDEICAWKFARNLSSPWDAFRVAVDGNHVLYTLWLRLAGDQRAWEVYRLPALVCGIAAIGLAIRVGARRDRPTALATGILFATSFLLTVYSSEARGYTPALLFVLAVLLVYERCLDEIRWPRLLSWWILALLGLCAHFSFAHFLLSAFLWSLARAWRSREPWRRRIAGLLALHAVPIALLAAFYFGLIRRMQYGGGDPWTPLGLASQTVVGTLGLPEPAAAVLLGALVLVAALAWDVRETAREGSDLWIPTLAMVVLAPAVTLVLQRSGFLAQRYFLLDIAFLLLALGRVAGRLISRAGIPRAAAALALLAIAAGNLGRTLSFLRVGRGDPLAAVRLMQEQTRGRVIRVGSDADFETGMTLEFYARYLSPGRTIAYVPGAAIRSESVDWWIQVGALRTDGPPRRVAIGDQMYDFVRSYPCYGPSGYPWALYRAGS